MAHDICGMNSVSHALALRSCISSHPVTIAVPTVSNTPPPTATAIFAFVHAITFNAPLMRVNVEPLTAAPFTAVAVTVAASPAARPAARSSQKSPPSTNACCQRHAAFANQPRSFSTARVTAFLAAPRSRPARHRLRPGSCHRNTAARRRDGPLRAQSGQRVVVQQRRDVRPQAVSVVNGGEASPPLHSRWFACGPPVRGGRGGFRRG